jgi:3-deoxy-7-phosphoheptulonate synthase
VAHETRHALLIAMRTYFEKPRTALGWKGLLTDPDLDGRGDPERGIERARRLLVALAELGVPCASELLDPLAPGYFGDLLAWAAVGARTSESQAHREMASGLDLPVAFKNGTDGRIESACNAIRSAREPHSFLGIDGAGAAAAIRSAGNPDAHLVLRGGESGPNYAPEQVARAAARLAGIAPARPILVDCSHDNSGKNPECQPRVLHSTIAQRVGGRREILGVMLESNLRPGRQDVAPGRPLRWGVSITDACLGWEETESLLFDAARALGRLGA